MGGGRDEGEGPVWSPIAAGPAAGGESCVGEEGRRSWKGVQQR